MSVNRKRRRRGGHELTSLQPKKISEALIDAVRIRECCQEEFACCLNTSLLTTPKNFPDLGSSRHAIRAYTHSALTKSKTLNTSIGG